MRYLTDLMTPATYTAFSRSDRAVAGFRRSQLKMAQKVEPGDLLLGYMMKFSRWVGILEVAEGPFIDDTPRFHATDDPFIVRFKVKPRVWLDRDHTLPIDVPEIWDTLSFTHGRSRSDYWRGPLRRSLQTILDPDGQFLEEAIRKQSVARQPYPIDEAEWERALPASISCGDRVLEVEVPEEDETASQPEELHAPSKGPRESIQIQAKLGEIGVKMGFGIWIPPADRGGVLDVDASLNKHLLRELPLGFDKTTMATVEMIDVLWLRGRSIIRAFEVEHTTAIYSGLLRMADLLALQPNLQIQLHIVAPIDRRKKFFSEVKRPVFSLLEPHPLRDVCSFLSYDTIEDLAAMDTLTYMRSEYLDEVAEEPE